MMHITVVCVTWNRPKQLGRMIRCFERQTYPCKSMVILDDAKQYCDISTRANVQGNDNCWRLVSARKRFATLGQKRNAAVRCLHPETDAIAVWDDDDLYLPWALEATVAALEQQPMSRPSLVLHPDSEWNLHQHLTGGLFHSGWGYRRDAFFITRGYPPMNCGEDQELLKRFIQKKLLSTDPLALGYRPFLVYPWDNSEVLHVSSHCLTDPNGGWKLCGQQEVAKTDITSHIQDPPFDLANPRIVPGVSPRRFDPEYTRFPITGYA